MSRFKWFLSGFIIIVVLFLFFWFPRKKTPLVSPLGPKIPGPLAKYAFTQLQERDYPGSEIKLEKVIQDQENYTAWLFSYQADKKKITGQANLPLGQGPWPVIVMLRGYADEEIYFTGLGTRKAAGVFAQNGFLTLAPDFLGFAGSDSSSKDILATRFNRPIEVLNLLASLASLPQADVNRVAIWAHSNGGQIGLSVLEISQKAWPMTLWNPVTLGFPESILAFMGEMDDSGQKVKNALDQFAQEYDYKLYSIDNYWQDIKAPLQVHQALADALVDPQWTDQFVASLQSLGKNIKYYVYPGDDHNLAQNWDLVVARDLDFFKSKLGDQFDGQFD